MKGYETLQIIVAIVVGMASATAILGALFKLGNNWIVGRIGLEVQGRLDRMMEVLKQDYVLRKELDLLVESSAETHKRHDQDIKDLWSAVNARKA